MEYHVLLDNAASTEHPSTHKRKAIANSSNIHFVKQ